MATTPLDAFTAHSANTLPSRAISAGSNRRAFVAVCVVHTVDTSPVTGCSWGDTAMNVLATASGTIDVALTLFEITEAQIAAKTGDGITISGGGPYTQYLICTWVEQGASQGDLSGNVATEAVGFTYSGGVSLARVADSHTTGITIHDSGSESYTTTNPSQTGSFTFGGTGSYGVEAGIDETATYTWSHSSQRDNALVVVNVPPAAETTQTIRKSSTFDIETTFAGNVVSATLNGNAITVDSHVGTTVTLTDTGSGITTSGEYPLVLTDDSATPQTETITVQVNVVGVTPSNNPVQKDGAALASLTGVQLRVTSGANINGTELYYSGTATTDASGNLSNIDLSSTAAADTNPVLLHMRTAAGDSLIASETVGLI